MEYKMYILFGPMEHVVTVYTTRVCKHQAGTELTPDYQIRMIVTVGITNWTLQPTTS